MAYADAYNGALSNVMEVVTSTASSASVSASQAESARVSAQNIQGELDLILQRALTSDLLTSAERQISEIADNLLARREFLDRVSLEGFRQFNREGYRETIEVHGGTGWGSWNEATDCRPNYYVCGLSQRVEGNQGRGDDTSVNDIRLRCCPLFEDEE